VLHVGCSHSGLHHSRMQLASEARIWSQVLIQIRDCLQVSTQFLQQGSRHRICRRSCTLLKKLVQIAAVFQLSVGMVRANH
jgi:hypothetical protein